MSKWDSFSTDPEGCYNGIDPPFTWKSNGQLLATGVQAPNGKRMVGFIERNGLRHGEFKLPSSAKDSVKLAHITFNVDSSILAVVCQDLSGAETVMQLWTVSNYKWQLKQVPDATRLAVLWSNI